MKLPINCILLIDDNEDDNFFHQRVIMKDGRVSIVKSCLNGYDGLAYINREPPYENENEFPRPNIIFLDINMPRMNGFEFLEKYNSIDQNKKAEICIVMLTTSRNPDDINKSNQSPDVFQFLVKPLTAQSFTSVVDLWLKLKEE